MVTGGGAEVPDPRLAVAYESRDQRVSLSRAQHRDLATTMIYTHVLNRGPAGVRSPADRILGA